VRRGQDIAVNFDGCYLVHHNLPEKHLDRHEHDEAILFLPLQGEITVKTDQNTLNCGVGRMIFLPSLTPHEFLSAKNQGERLIFLFAKKVWDKYGCKEATERLVPQSQLIKELGFYLLLHRKSPHATVLVRTMMGVLAETLNDEELGCILGDDLQHALGKIADPRLKKVVHFLEKNYTEAVTMPELARVSGLSLRSLNRLLLNELGLSPKQLLIKIRMDAATSLLQKGTSVTATAMEVGYSSLSQFIQTFQKTTGKLPSDLFT